MFFLRNSSSIDEPIQIPDNIFDECPNIQIYVTASYFEKSQEFAGKEVEKGAICPVENIKSRIIIV